VNYKYEPKVQDSVEKAFVLLRVKPGKLFKVAQEARNDPDVKISRAVAGFYDVMLLCPNKSLEEIPRENTLY
jgi:hypothetical protein